VSFACVSTGASFKVINTDRTRVLESFVTNMNLIATGASLPPLGGGKVFRRSV